jgi:hypothetical protein
MVYSRARIGPEFEIKGECELVRSTTGEYQAGIVMGLPEPDHNQWYAFRLKHNAHEGDAFAYSQGWSWANTPHVKLNSGRNSFAFLLHNCQAGVTVNGQTILTNAPKPAGIAVCDNQFLIGFGAYNDMNETVVRYSHVQVRRLPAGPSPPSGTGGVN